MDALSQCTTCSSSNKKQMRSCFSSSKTTHTASQGLLFPSPRPSLPPGTPHSTILARLTNLMMASTTLPPILITRAQCIVLGHCCRAPPRSQIPTSLHLLPPTPHPLFSTLRATPTQSTSLTTTTLKRSPSLSLHMCQASTPLQLSLR